MTATLTLPHVVSSQNVQMIWDWMTTRGGIAIWRSEDLSDPGQTWTAPRCDQHGNVKAQGPNWKCAREPYRIITDPDEILVTVDVEVRRFRVALRRGAQGLKVKLTDASTSKVNKAVEKAGDKAFYCFDYETQEAIIMAPESEQTLRCWAHGKGLI